MKRTWQLVRERFGMTREEKRMVALILFVALVGLAARHWNMRHAEQQPYPDPDAATTPATHPHAAAPSQDGHPHGR